MIEERREFAEGRRLGTTLYKVKGVVLDRLDLIYHLFCWARDNNVKPYPKKSLMSFLRDIIDFDYSSKEKVTQEEAETIAKFLEEKFFRNSKKLRDLKNE